MRLRHNKNAAGELAQSRYFLNQFPIQLNDQSVLEIGAGKGEMITQMALNNPNKTFYALEKYPTVAHKILKKINQLELNNLFIITKDAVQIPELFNGKINELWLTFCDPWPKNAHEKRRLTYKNFLALYETILSRNGKLKFKTDNDKLFEYSVESFKQNNWEILGLTNNLHQSKFNKDNYPTGYEIKWSSKGKNINYLEARKI
ncbi:MULTISPECIES: tRNA (guanosine(46)-N7)-methyltransferase TrmB [unclassified Mycoplasma]|uniref:tRNA (guanosine(46)-N7)-methyltransferase TrmB n=1 Tax=unclassified Mycoplasma TaxID=2683645 RepID=UPI00211C73C4|nr:MULTISPECIES: tRNA (guanosine(46)-N7)-methyltransferase TrmB [unclassified Mycoplasma]UUM19801.1 tRNA (guanosine(46)-N7)-methyltransferase TrmB [Mycoplasma sp. 1578d]UUM24785.1 tRNA (guanosine(46)-N7)-methyltransferase TrmB [Mycoplasma sp. 3686d]